MAIEQTLSIIKPDAVRKNHIGAIINLLEQAGLSVKKGKMLHLTKDQASTFYAIHQERPFFNDLVTFMSSGPVFVLALEGEDAVACNRRIMGATNPADADKGTIRQLYAESIDYNAVHGSDSLENAAIEVEFFFPE